ncbi:MAG: Ig-like domain-containing protein [Prevotellaceae bacterium]|nr:Ig-like domain-containing protein [Prevotellaceae bacterium]
MTKHLRLLMLALLAIICTGGVKAAVGDTYKLVKSTDELKAGDVIVIAESYNKMAMGGLNSTYFKGVSISEIVNGVLTSKSNDISEVTLAEENGNKYLKIGDSYLKSTGKGNLSLSTSNTDKNTIVSIAFSGNSAKISFGSQSYYVCYNSGSPRFACYAGGATSQQRWVQIYKKQDSGKTTTTTFGAGYDGKTFTFTDGVLEGFTAPKATWSPAEVKGSVAYSSSDTEIVTVDANGALTFTNTKFGTATITATFTPTEATKYKTSSASYTVVNKEGERIATTIAFAEGIENSIVTVKDGETFDGYKATCTTEGAKGAIQYSSSNTDVATVDESTGAVTMGSKYGKTVITAQFIGTGGYANSNKISYTIEYKGDYAFYESFDKCDGVGGWSGNVAAGPWDKNKLDNAWTKTGTVLLGAGCIRVGKAAASVTTPSIAISGSAVLTFKAGLWDTKKESTPVIVTISDGTLTYGNNTAKTISLNPGKGQWEEFEIVISGTKSFTLTFKNNDNTDNNRFFLDEVMVKEIAAADVTLDEERDNVVEAAENANVTLKRTLYADGGWNTLCLPFSLTDEQTKAAFGDDVELRTLVSFDGKTLTFAKATGITAGVPCLIKVSKVAENNTYTFTGVSVKAIKADADKYDMDKSLTCVGIYAPMDVAKAFEKDGNALFLGAANKFYKAKADTKMKAFRAFFLVPASTDIQALRAVIDGTTTGIDDLNIDTVKADGRVYNLNGQCVGYSLEGLKAGIYIQNGKKVIKK